MLLPAQAPFLTLGPLCSPHEDFVTWSLLRARFSLTALQVKWSCRGNFAITGSFATLMLYLFFLPPKNKKPPSSPRN